MAGLQPGKVEHQLWQGFKENDMAVPIRADKHELGDARHRQLVLASMQSAFETSYENASKGVAGCAIQKRSQCRYASNF